MPLGNKEFLLKFKGMISFLLSIFNTDFNLLYISLLNKKDGNPSFFFSLYIMILEQIPIKFLNNTISFISSFILEFLSFPISNWNDGNSTLLNPQYISPLIIVFFLLNLNKRQLISFSDNWHKYSLLEGVVNWFSILILIYIDFFLSLNFNSNNLKFIFG